MQLTMLKLSTDPSNQAVLNFNSFMKWIPDLKGAQESDLFRLIQTKSLHKNLVADSSKWVMEKASKASAVFFYTFKALESATLF